MKIQTRDDIQKLSVGDYLKVYPSCRALSDADKMIIIHVTEVDHASLDSPQARGEILVHSIYSGIRGKFMAIPLLATDISTEIITYDAFVAIKLSAMGCG